MHRGRRCRERRGRHRHGRRVFWRVYLHGIILLVAVAAGVGIANKLLWSGMPAPVTMIHQRLARYLDQELSGLLDDPAALDAKVERLAAIFEVDVAVYNAAGERLADYGGEVAPLEAVPEKAYMRGYGRRQRFAVPLDNGRAYVVGAYQWQWGSAWAWLIIPAVVLLVLALVSLSMARGIARPVERITRAARALGEGDLAARSGVDAMRRDELGVLARAFDEMAARLERMVNNEKELLANVSHELRTPLARIRIALELAEDEDDPGATRERLRGIGGDLAELEQLVEQVLLTARLDLTANTDGTLPLQRAPTSMEDIVGEAEQRFVRLHDGDRLVVRIEPDLPPVDVDSKLVRRVLDNLLDNAVKYADGGPIELEVALRADDGCVAVSVSDRGIGVDPDDLPMLFEPFFRSDRSRERGTGGVGLGLALCRRIVAAHDGTIEARCREGGGLCVALTLPLA